jgi:hypothetical protein
VLHILGGIVVCVPLPHPPARHTAGCSAHSRAQQSSSGQEGCVWSAVG